MFMQLNMLDKKEKKYFKKFKFAYNFLNPPLYSPCKHPSSIPKVVLRELSKNPHSPPRAQVEQQVLA